MAKQRYPRAKVRGFTLLEIMIALTIFATLTAAVMAASHYGLQQQARLQERLQCAWLADNQLSELRLLDDPPVGRQRLPLRLDQRDWLLEQTIIPGPDLRMLKVDISVSHAGSDQPVYHTTGWIPARHE